MAEEFFKHSKTPCQRQPECCAPRRIRHVALDADGVLWHIKPYAIASSVRGPFKLIDPDTVEAGEESYAGVTYVTPKPKPRPTKELSPEEEKRVEAIARDLMESVPEEKREALEKREKPEKPTAEQVELRWDPTRWRWYQLEERTPTKEKWVPMPLEEEPPIPDDPTKVKRIITSRLKKPENPSPHYELPFEFDSEYEHYEPPKGRKITVTLLPTLRDTLDELEKRGISMSVISLNTPGSVRDLLEAFGLAHKFIEIKDTWQSKDKVFREITTKHKICPCDAIFVDDTLGNIQAVAKECAMALHMGDDIKKPAEILAYILAEK